MSRRPSRGSVGDGVAGVAVRSPRPLSRLGPVGVALLHLAQRCRRRMAKWSRFPSRRLSEVLKAINPGIADGV
jgi:hypothetical protein